MIDSTDYRLNNSFDFSKDFIILLVFGQFDHNTGNNKQSRKNSGNRGDNISDGKSVIHVSYRGILPDLFREGQGVVAEGVIESNSSFVADVVLAKHDETYMPKDVADALKKQGHWKDDYGKKSDVAQDKKQ